MALTESSMIPLGTEAPDFSLKDAISGETKTLADVKSEKGLVVMFICAHCPYVKHIEEEIEVISHQYVKHGIGFVAICSNDAENYPEDAPEKLVEQAENCDFNFPYLVDETQEVAKAYQAVCTPEFYLFDEALKCVYRGRFDESTPGNNEPVSGEELKEAIENLLEGEPPLEVQHPSAGCNIKWKS